MSKFRPSFLIASVCLPVTLLLVFSGCATHQTAEELEQQRLQLQEKVERFQNLQADLASGKIKTGTTPATIRDLYGEPDDIIRSSTGASTMEIWTFERVGLDKEEDFFSPLRIYFNNNKMVSWIQ